jgi:hypothetical protein
MNNTKHKQELLFSEKNKKLYDIITNKTLVLTDTIWYTFEKNYWIQIFSIKEKGREVLI